MYDIATTGSRGATNIGVTGISLEGYTSSLLATVKDRLHLDQGKYLKEMAAFMREIGFDRA